MYKVEVLTRFTSSPFYPLSFHRIICLQLTLGLPLPVLRNAVTGGRTAAFHEPALDYVVVKVTGI